MYELVKYSNGTRHIHGVADRVSELIDHYYKNRKQWGYMQVEDTSDNNKVLATLSSEVK